MTMTSYSNAIVNTMLGWLKGLANWVLRLFNLAGCASTSPLLWLSHNWMKLLIFFLVIGIGVDLLVWLIRWRPYWVWFRKERVIVNDDKFFAEEDVDPDADWEDDRLDKNWQERNYVVASTLKPQRRQNTENREKREPVHRSKGGKVSTAQRKRPAASKGKNTEPAVKSGDALFDVDANLPDTTDFYEDEVFNVSNLPEPGEYRDDRE